MKNGLVIADSGSIFSLAIVNKLEVLDALFDSVRIPEAVWTEITQNESAACYHTIINYFKSKVEKITAYNDLLFMMDEGESESVILYRELNANFLLIDDKKARRIAENLGINCIGTLGLLSIGKEKGLIQELKPIFVEFLENKRFYSIELLNSLLITSNELPLN